MAVWRPFASQFGWTALHGAGFSGYVNVVEAMADRLPPSDLKELLFITNIVSATRRHRGSEWRGRALGSLKEMGSHGNGAWANGKEGRAVWGLEGKRGYTKGTGGLLRALPRGLGGDVVDVRILSQRRVSRGSSALITS